MCLKMCLKNRLFKKTKKHNLKPNDFEFRMFSIKKIRDGKKSNSWKVYVCISYGCKIYNFIVTSQLNFIHISITVRIVLVTVS